MTCYFVFQKHQEMVEAAQKRRVKREPSRYTVDCEDAARRLRAIGGNVL